MPDIRLTPRCGLETFVDRDQRVPPTDACVSVTLHSALALAAVAVRRGQHDAVAHRVGETFGLVVPTSCRRVVAGSIAWAWAGPGHWLASSEDEAPEGFERRLRDGLAGSASVFGQSDAWTVFRVCGPQARQALAKGIPVDLHAGTFKPGDVALTTVGHMYVHFWQLDTAPTYEFAVSRSYARSFLDWLVEASAQFGADVSTG